MGIGIVYRLRFSDSRIEYIHGMKYLMYLFE